MAVELVGAPGSGKSTLAGWLAGRAVPGASRDGTRRLIPADLLLQVSRRRARPVGARLRHREVLALVARHPRLGALLLAPSSRRTDPRVGGHELGAAWDGAAWDEVREAVRAVSVPGPRGDATYRTAAIGWLQETARLIEASRSAPRGVIPLLHEGLVQRTLSVLGASAGPDSLGLLLGMRPPGDLLVHLNVSEGRLIERAERRMHHGTLPDLHRGRTRDEIAGLVTEDAIALARTVDRLVHDGVRVLRLTVDVDGRQLSVEELGSEVLRFVAHEMAADRH